MTGAKHDHNSPRGAHSTPAVPSIPLSEDSAARVRAGSADGSGSGNGKVAADASIGSLIKDASAHVSTLVRAEVELARSEVVAEVKKGVKGSVFFIVALTILLFSLFYFFFAIAELLADIGLYRSAAFGIVFGFMLVLAGLCAFLGWRKVRKIRAPQRTISTVKDTAAVLKSSGRAHPEIEPSAAEQRPALPSQQSHGQHARP